MDFNHAPQLASYIILRRRVSTCIRDAFSRGRILYVSAQTGFGKTTAAASWLRRSDTPHIWIDCRQQVLSATLLQEAADRLPQRGVLVIDCWEQLMPPAAEPLCSAILRMQNRCLILSRTGLPAALRHPSSGVQLLSAEDLAFTAAETEELLDAFGIHERRAAIISALKDSDGWALVCYYMIQVILEQRRPFDAAIQQLAYEAIFEYFDREFYADWTPRQRYFMLTAGCFDTLTSEQMRQLSGCMEAADEIEQFMDSSSFYKKVAAHTYQIFPFFREYLIDRQKKFMQQDELHSLYRSAGRLFEHEEQYHLAMCCYLQFGDMESLSCLLERISLNGVAQAKLWEYRRFYHALPQDIVRKSPSLCCAMAMLGVVQFHPDEAEQWIHQLHIMRDALPKNDPCRMTVESKLAYLTIACPYRHRDHLMSHMRTIASAAVHHEIAMQNVSLTANRPSTYNGGMDFSRYHRFIPILVQPFDAIVTALFPRDGVGCADLGMAEWLYLKNRTSDALLRVVSVLPKIERYGDISTRFAANFLQMKIMLVSGQLLTAKTMLSHIQDDVTANRADYLQPNLDAVKAWVALYEADHETIAIWIETKAPNETGELCTLDRFCYTVKLRYYLSQGRHLELLALGERLRPILLAFNRHIELCELELLEALSWHRKKKRREAFSHLRACLVLAEKYGLLRVLADEGMSASRLLQEYGSGHRLSAFAKETMEEARHTGLYFLDYLSSPADAISPLTKTELEVLRLMADGCTNAGICEVLDISLNTAKSHAKNIFSKLQVKSRTQAVKKAREMKLIS